VLVYVYPCDDVGGADVVAAENGFALAGSADDGVVALVEVEVVDGSCRSRAERLALLVLAVVGVRSLLELSETPLRGWAGGDCESSRTRGLVVMSGGGGGG